MPSRRLYRSISLGAVLTGGVLAGSPACSSTPSFDGTDSATGGSGPCVIEDKALCGESCNSDNGCATGLYCDPSSDTCQAECVAGETASEHCDGAPCDANGRCIGQTGSGGTPAGSGGGFNPPPSSGGNGGEGGGNNCIDVEVTPTPIIPNVALLMDKSRSMTGENNYDDLVQDAINAGDYTPWECAGAVPGFDVEDFGTAELWRWNVARTVLFNPDDGIVTQLGSQVRFGITTYSYDSQTQGSVCPALASADLAFDNRDAMLANFPCSDLIWETPTRESLVPTADALAAAQVEGPKFIVLATDGAPDNCDPCPNFNGGECNSDAQVAEMDAVVAEATRIHDELGIVLHVIDMSSPGQSAAGVPLFDHLTEVAAAGGGDIYDGTDPAGLIQAFRDIIAEAQSCVVDLDGMVVEGQESNGTVTLGGEELVYEDDWIMPSPSQIELIGDACITFKAESPTLSITFPCGDFVVK